MRAYTKTIENIKSRSTRFPLVLQVSLFALLAVIVPQWTGCAAHPLQGKEAPSFNLRLVDGGTLDLAQHLGKRPIVLDFWAVWCPACRAGIPGTASAAARFKSQDVVICTVNLGDNREDIVSFLKSNAIAAPVAMDERSSLSGIYNLEGIPTKVFINRDGMISRVVVGSMTASSLTEAIEELL